MPVFAVGISGEAESGPALRARGVREEARCGDG